MQIRGITAANLLNLFFGEKIEKWKGRVHDKQIITYSHANKRVFKTLELEKLSIKLCTQLGFLEVFNLLNN